MNQSEQTLRCIEVLTVFLKDEEPQAHIKFESLTALQPRQTAVVRHRTWTEGKPVDAGLDNKLERLRVVAGQASPYVLHISWDDAEGKKRFQRIGAGH
jgi:hypothetical protein